MHARSLAMLLLVAAGVANLPMVHALLRRDDAEPYVVLPAGLLAMGLAWAGGCAIQERRRGSVIALAALGVAEGAVALVPPAREAVGASAVVWVALAALLSAAALVVLLSRRVPVARA